MKRRKKKKGGIRAREASGGRYRIEPLLNAKQVAAAIGVVDRTIDRWMKEGTFPLPDVRMTRFRRWRKQTVARWARENGQKSAAEKIAGK